MENQNILASYIKLYVQLSAPYLRILAQKRLHDVHKNSKNPINYYK